MNITVLSVVHDPKPGCEDHFKHDVSISSNTLNSLALLSSCLGGPCSGDALVMFLSFMDL